MYLNNKFFIMIIYLAAMAASPPFSTDVYLASMPNIAHVFHTSSTHVQLTLSLFFIGFALAQLFWGPLSDRIGRKPVVFWGLLIYFIASLLCAWSTNITFLILARILQAVGACSGVVVAMAIVKDSFPEHVTMSKVLSIMLSVMMIAPMIAPVIGSFLLMHFNWRANFYFLAIYAFLLILAAFFFHESYPVDIRKPLPINSLLQAYVEQIKCRRFLLATFAVSTNFSVMFAFIASSPFIYINLYHLSPGLFGYFFAFNASALIFGNISLSQLKKCQFTTQKIIIFAVIISILGALSMLLAIILGINSIWEVTIPAFIATYGAGILYAELTTCVLQNVVAYTGIASSLLGVHRFVLAGFISLLMGLIIHGTAWPLGVVMLILSCLTGISMWRYFSASPT